MLGYAAGRSGARWLALAAGEPLWAAAFEGFEGYLSVPPEAIRPYEAQGPAAAFAATAALLGGRLRPILDLEEIRKSIQENNFKPTQRSL